MTNWNPTSPAEEALARELDAHIEAVFGPQRAEQERCARMGLPITPPACCDYCPPDKKAAHIERQRAEYTEYTAKYPPPEGWRVIPFGADIPNGHIVLDCMALYGPRWLDRPRNRSTVTPIWAKRAGWMGLFAEKVPT